MPPITGKQAVVDGATGVGFWGVEWTSSDASVVHSATEGTEIVLPGNTDWRGVYQSYGHTPINMPGDKFTFKGIGSTDKGVYSAANGAIVERVDIIWDLATARAIYHNLYFAANGILTLSDDVSADTGAAAEDSGYVAPSPSKTMVTKWGTPTVPDVFYMMLSLIAKNALRVDSSTAGQVKRDAGNKSVRWMYKRYLEDPDLLPDIDDIAQLRFYVDADTYWDIHDAIVKQVAPKWVIEGGRDKRAKYVEATIRGKFSVPDGTDYVANPATTKWIDFTD